MVVEVSPPPSVVPPPSPSPPRSSMRDKRVSHEETGRVPPSREGRSRGSKRPSNSKGNSVPPPPPNSLELPQRKPRQSKAPPRRTLEYSGEPEPDYEEADTDDATLPELDNKLRGACRYLALTMSGGPPQLLAICSTRELEWVLKYASLRLERWSKDLLRVLYDELKGQDTLLYSRRLIDYTRSHHGAGGGAVRTRENSLTQCAESVSYTRDATASSSPPQPPPPHLPSFATVVGGGRLSLPPPICPHLLLKRRSLSVQILTLDGKRELILASSASSGHRERIISPDQNGGSGAAAPTATQLLSQRLGGTLKDQSSPSVRASELIVTALSVDPCRIIELGWHSLTTNDLVPYPGLECQRTHYVVQVNVADLAEQDFQCVPQPNLPVRGGSPRRHASLPHPHEDENSGEEPASTQPELPKDEWSWRPTVNLLTALHSERLSEAPTFAEPRRLPQPRGQVLSGDERAGAPFSSLPRANHKSRKAQMAVSNSSPLLNRRRLDGEESAAHGKEGSPVKLVPIPGTSLIAAVAPLHGSLSPGSSQRRGLERSMSTSILKTPSPLRSPTKQQKLSALKPAAAASSPSNAARSPPPLNSWRAWAEYGREHQNQQVSKGSPERPSLTNHAALKAAFLTPLPLSPVMQHQKPQQAVSPQTQTPLTQSTWTAHMLAPITFHETLSPTKKKMA